MDNIKKKLKNFFCDKELYVFSIITIMFFGIFCIMQYAPDTYSVFSNDIVSTTSHFLACGRFVTGAFIYFFMSILKLSNHNVYRLSYIIAVLCTIIALYKLNKLIKKDVKNNALSIIISTLIIINPFSLELFLYIEKGIMMLSVLLCVLAVEQIDKFFSGSKKSIIYALILMVVANFCYQGTVGVFVAISIVYVIKYSKNIKDFVLNNIVVALTYGIPAVINFLIVRFAFVNERVKGKIVLTESITKMIQGTENMVINTYKLLPKYLFIAMIIILLGFIIYKTIVKKTDIKGKTLQVLGALYLIIISLIATVAPQLLQDTNKIWFVARSSYPIASIIGILSLYFCMDFRIKNIIKNILMALLTIFLVIQFGKFMRFSIDNYIGNYMDKTVSLQINTMILEYEEQSGNKIDSIALYKDHNTLEYYQNLNATGDINIRAYCADWCIMPILKLYTNKQYKFVEQDMNLKEKFKNTNWDCFDKEQVIFKNNVMHLCIF